MPAFYVIQAGRWPRPPLPLPNALLSSLKSCLRPPASSPRPELLCSVLVRLRLPSRRSSMSSTRRPLSWWHRLCSSPILARCVSRRHRRSGGFNYESQVIREPYSQWAEGHIARIKKVLNDARAQHTGAVQERIESVGQMKDVVSITKGLFALSKVCI